MMPIGGKLENSETSKAMTSELAMQVVYRLESGRNGELERITRMDKHWQANPAFQNLAVKLAVGRDAQVKGVHRQAEVLELEVNEVV